MPGQLLMEFEVRWFNKKIKEITAPVTNTNNQPKKMAITSFE